MWILFMLVMASAALAALVWLVARVRGLTPFARLGARHGALAWLLAALPVAALALGFARINVPTAVVVLLHLMLFWALCALLGRLIGRLTRRRIGRDAVGIVAIAITAAYLGVGWFMAHHVFQTHYALTTDKDLGGRRLRIVEIADSHLGITLDGARFAGQMARIQALEPDAVVFVGDFVDDDSDADDMRAACAALGGLETPLGVYFVYGNHDEGYFDHRNFTAAELRQALADSGVTVLEDGAALAGEHLCIVGRKDRSMPGRADAASLSAGLDPSRYIVMLDHQPNDYAAEAATPADLVLSGHTHGGHIFPAGLIGLAMGANDRVYGTEVRDGTTFIVTSGISGWAIPFKTGTFSEFVVIDIE